MHLDREVPKYPDEEILKIEFTRQEFDDIVSILQMFIDTHKFDGLQIVVSAQNLFDDLVQV